MEKTSKPLHQQHGSRFWLTLLVIIDALGFYTLTIILPIPTAVGLFVRYNLVALTLIAIPTFFFIFKIKGLPGTLLGLGITLILFALPLNGLWRSGASEPFIIGGLIPFSDASSYYSDALRVTEGFRFSAFSARRPLFPALLTVLLAVTGQNLMVSIAILTGLIAIACYLAAREMQRSLGTFPAAIFIFILFLFYRRISGTTMTENLGFPLGISGFVVLWSAARNHKRWLAAAGLLFLTLALNARAGTFFILPALILWSGFAFRGKRKFSLFTAGVCIAAAACGFLLNMLVFKLIADPGGMVFSNFSYTLYGVVAGGKGWMQILIDHPELAKLDDVARSAQTYSLVFEAWNAHPLNIIVGALKNWFDYLMPRGAGAFGFIRGNETYIWANYAVRIILSLLAGWGVVIVWKLRKTEPYNMMLWAAAGIFLSVPFVPPNDSNQMRVYAATVTFLIAFSMIGLRGLHVLLRPKHFEIPTFEQSNGKPALFFGIMLSTITICGALLVKGFTLPDKLPQAECPIGQTQLIVRITPNSLVQIGRNQESLEDQISVPVESFISQNEGYPEMHAELVKMVENGAVLTRPLDLISMQYPLLIMNGETQSLTKGLLNLCAIQTESKELTRRSWLQVESFSILK